MNWYYCINDDQWHHHFEDNNYSKITKGLTIDNKRVFVKIARKFPLEDWNRSTSFLAENFRLLLSIMKT